MLEYQTHLIGLAANTAQMNPAWACLKLTDPQPNRPWARGPAGRPHTPIILLASLATRGGTRSSNWRDRQSIIEGILGCRDA